MNKSGLPFAGESGQVGWSLYNVQSFLLHFQLFERVPQPKIKRKEITIGGRVEGKGTRERRGQDPPGLSHGLDAKADELNPN